MKEKRNLQEQDKYPCLPFTNWGNWIDIWSALWEGRDRAKEIKPQGGGLTIPSSHLSTLLNTYITRGVGGVGNVKEKTIPFHCLVCVFKDS